MDKLQQLYNLYLDQGIITEAVSFEEFSNINENQQQQLFDLGKQSGLFVTATIEDFSNSWPKVEPEPVTSTRADVRERDLKKKDSESLLEDGFSEQPEQPVQTSVRADVRAGDLERAEYEQKESVADDTIAEPISVRAQTRESDLERIEIIPQEEEAEALLKERKMEVLDLALQLPTFDFEELNEDGQQIITEMASKYDLSPSEFLKEAKDKKQAVVDSDFGDWLYNSFKIADVSIGEMIATLPSSAYEFIGAAFSDPINRALGLPETNVEAFKELIGTKDIIEGLVKEQEYREKQDALYRREKGLEGGIVEAFGKGEYEKGRDLLLNAIVQSAPISLGIMAASASGVGLLPLATGATALMTGPELRKQLENNPDQTKALSVLKAVGMAGAEMVFSTISQGTLARVYKDIIFQQGKKEGVKAFKKTIIGAYEGALKKFGPIAAAAGEAIEEVATQITQNLIEGKPVFQGVPDAAVTGFASGGVYGAPITAIQATKYANEGVAKWRIKNKIKKSEYSDIVGVFETQDITELQFDLADTKRADEILTAELKRRVDTGEMTKEDSDRIQQNFFETSVYKARLEPKNLTTEQKVKAINLLKEKQALLETINTIDEKSLSIEEQKRVDEINTELAELVTITETIKTEEDAISKQGPEGVDVQEQTRDSEEVGEGDTTGELTGPLTPKEDESTEFPEEEITQLTKEKALKNLKEKQKALRDLEAQIVEDGKGSPSIMAFDKARREINKAKAELDKLINKPKEEVTELTEEQKDEVADLEYIIGAPKGKQPKFRLSEEQVAELDTEDIENTMNQFEEQELNYTTPELTKDQPPVNPVAESKSTVKIDETQANELVKPIEEFNGIPMLTGITDMLAAGVVEDSQGNPMEVEGGVLFNVLGKNKDFAWAGVTKDAAQKQYDNAVALYNNNKELFDRLWAEGKLPNGHVPMAIMRMADSAINSNEAVFRFILPTLNTIPQANNQKALETFVDTIVKSQKNKSKVDQIVKAIKDNNIKGLNELFDFIVKDASARAKGDLEGTLPLDTRSLIYDVIFSKPGVKTNNSQIVKDLFEGIESKNELFLSDTIYEALGEPSVKKANQGEVMSIVGIDVLNGGVSAPIHGNYGYGPKGQPIALISNPTHGIDVFPEWKAKATRVFKKTKPKTEKKKPSFPKPETVGGQTMGAFATDKAFIGPKVKVGEASDVDNLVGMLRLAFPQVSVATTQEEFDATLESPGVRTRETKGKTILGITMDGKIYLNPNYQSLATPIHEFGHVWIDYLRSDVSGKKGTELLNQGLKLVEGTDALKRAIEKYGDNQLAREEALVELMGTKGETIANAAKRSKFKEWLNGLFKYIKETFTRSKDIKREDIESLTLEDFINIGLADLFSGELVNGKFDVKTAENAAKARFELLESIGGPELSMKEIIETGRAEGFSDAAIKAVLQGRGFKAADINPAMELALKKGEVLPAAFQNIEGGVDKGLKLFRSIQKKINEFKKNNKVTKAKVRAKAQEILKNTDVYKSLSEFEKNELLVALDRTMETRANRTIQKEITRIKNIIRGYKEGVKDLRSAQIQLKNFIRNALPVSQGYSQNDIADTVALVTNIKSKKDFPAAVEKVLKKVEAARERKKKSLITKLQKFVSSKAKVISTGSKRRKSKGLDAQGQQFFSQVNQILKAALGSKAIDRMAVIANELSNIKRYNEIIAKEAKGEELSVKDSKFLDKSIAFEMFADIKDKSLEDVQALFEDLQSGAEISRQVIKEKRLRKAEKDARLQEQVTSQIEKDFGTLFKTDKNGKKVLKSIKEIRADIKEINKSFAKLKIWQGLKKLYENYDFTISKNISAFFRTKIAHLGSLTRILDNYSLTGFFQEQVYDRLNIMSENSLRGKFYQQKIIDSIAESVEGIEGGYSGVLEKLQKIGLKEITEENKKVEYTADQIMRMYALSLNDVQRERLRNEGIKDIEEIKDILGPELVSFTDKIVEYLSNDYFESLNDVYSDVNDTNLGYVENYFPTASISDADQAKLIDGDFNSVLGLENASSLKERTAKDLELNLEFGFTYTLENYINSMERYKSYASGTREFNTIFNTEAVKTLIDKNVLDVGDLIKTSINYEINPTYGLRNEIKDSTRRIFGWFTSYSLSFKFIQIFKQMTSFVNAFNEHQFRPGKYTPVVDTLSFLGEYALVLANFRSNLKKMKEVSATFRERLEKGLEGDIYSLESGGLFQYLPETSAKVTRLRKNFRKAAAAPTVLGDVLGVMGYVANYNRNIKNGMSQAEALKAFNNYNATQQSRRNTEKSPIQRAKGYNRVFTSFGSTLFLQMNRVAMAQRNIFAKHLLKGKVPPTKDIRDLALNLSIANALFVATSNIAKLWAGDDEDRKEVYLAIGEAAIGLNLLYQIPLFGIFAEQVVQRAEVGLGLRKRARTSSPIVNPFNAFWFKLNRFIKDPTYFSAIKGVIDGVLGVQTDPVVGVINLFKDMEADEGEIYDMLGISKSYRPRDKKIQGPPPD
jgi:RNA polymerase-interacting CarD/CdnL/TRCF family regulator